MKREDITAGLAICAFVAGVAAFIISLVGCSTVAPGLFPPTSGTRIDIDCSRENANCFTEAEVVYALELFAREYQDFNVHAQLTLEVYPYHSVIKGRAWAEAPNSRRVRLSRLIDLPHELIHIHHMRTHQPRDFHPELPDGSRPWVNDPLDNEREARLKAAFLVAFPGSAQGPR